MSQDENDIILNKNSAMIIAMNFSKRFDAWKYHNGWECVQTRVGYFYRNKNHKFTVLKNHDDLVNIYMREKGIKGIKLKYVIK